MLGQHISLFSGVGMLDLAAEEAGFKTIATAEVLPFCNHVLDARFPGTLRYKDVKDVRVVDDTLRHAAAGVPLLMTGGFPCTDISGLGAGLGLAGVRSGLWFEFARCIREFHPDYVLIENVTMLRSRGMGTVLQDLASLGYEALWECIPAAYVGAPHLRDRIWIMARKRAFTIETTGPLLDVFHQHQPGCFGRSGVLTQGKFGLARTPITIKAARQNAALVHSKLLPTPRSAPNEWRTTRNAPTHGNGHGKTLAGELNDRWRASHPGQTPPRSSESAGNVDPTYVEWMMGVPFGWTDPEVTISARDFDPPMDWRDPRAALLQTLVDSPPYRRDRLMALGNGLVPQVARIALDILINS